ncbi:MAG TPA: hypothetical protein VMT62_00805 [Syntrophorhabdaceae bacterium]|nr:hypothetical protein [Syntrophorhabdaceae bacterium]
MILYSSEARWFVSYVSFKEILKWFGDGRDTGAGVVQEHEYLVLPDCTSTGIKLREGKLEVKALRGLPRVFALKGGIEGVAEEWVKWSVARGDWHERNSWLVDSGTWLKVRKERFIRRYTYGSGEFVEISGPKEALSNEGYNVEVTAIQADVKPADWVTIGFEAFGSATTMKEILSLALQRFFEELGQIVGVPLTQEQSFGYPRWLSKVVSS